MVLEFEADRSFNFHYTKQLQNVLLFVGLFFFDGHLLILSVKLIICIFTTSPFRNKSTITQVAVGSPHFRIHTLFFRASKSY